MDSLKVLIHLMLTLMVAKTGCAQVQRPSHKFIDNEIDCWDLHSTIIGEDYTIYVHVPPGYDVAKTAYPVLYLTDGDWDKYLTISAFNMLRQDYITQEAIIVGIGYGERPNRRDRDLEPAKGGPSFLSFIEKELIPFITGKYRVTDERVLSGYSYGGLFATYALFNRPGLFHAICIGAPATSSALVSIAQKYFIGHQDLRTRIFLIAGSYEHQTVLNLVQLKDALLKQNCTVELDTVPNAGHGTAKPQAIQQGVAFAFCKKHEAIALSAADLEKYEGTYALAGNSAKQIKFYVQNAKLYGSGGGLPLHLIPFSSNGFFIYENEKVEMFFKTENGKMYELYVPYDGKPVRFDKIN